MTEDIKLREFETLCKDVFNQKIVLDKIKEDQEKESEKLEALKKKVLAYMEEFDKDKHPVKGFGTLSVQEKFYAKMPKEPEKKALFFEYLKMKGLFEGMLSVNANTLNSFVDRELEAAREANDFEFAIPGIDDLGHYKILKVLK